jgi:hypothetical protein
MGRRRYADATYPISDGLGRKGGHIVVPFFRAEDSSQFAALVDGAKPAKVPEVLNFMP